MRRCRLARSGRKIAELKRLENSLTKSTRIDLNLPRALAVPLRDEVIQTPGYLSAAALVPIGARSDYFASSAHYESVARRIVAALRGGSRPFVLVTGDPPVNPQALSAALGNVAGRGYAVIIISCGPELRREDLEGPVPTLAKPKAA